MNSRVNKLLLAGEKFITEMQLRQPGFSYTACGPFKFKKQEIQDIFIKVN